MISMANTKCFIFFIFHMLILSACEKSQERIDVAKYVDPFICTQGDHGHWHPSALRPFGLVKLGPDTYPGSLIADGDFAHAGYDFSDNQLRGFSHLRRGSSGGGSIHDRAGLLAILPFSKEREADWFKSPIVDFDKSKEIAKCGYYATYLPEDKIGVELSASDHVGFHRYTFQNEDDAKIMINGRKGNLTVKKIDNKNLEGFLKAGNTTFYFTMIFNASIINTRSFTSEGIVSDAISISNVQSGGYLCDFEDLKGKPLEIEVSLSFTSQEGARKNYIAEGESVSFDQASLNGYNAWNEILSRVEVEGKNEERKRIFYTALYHSCFLPIQFCDADGTYLGMDGEVHPSPGFKFYGSYAFWDSFRSKYALYSLLIPEKFSDIVSSLKLIYSQIDNYEPFPNADHRPHGYCFKGEGKKGGMWTDCRHEHMLMVVMDAYKKGLCKFPISDVYDYMKREVMVQMPEKYDSIGYIPNRVDQTGDYSWDNWSLAQAAKGLGKKDDYNYFMKRAEYWKNTFDPSIKYFRARSVDGAWLDFPDDPAENREKYAYEGSKWHLRWNTLHDIPGLIELFGGKKYFLNELNYFFDNYLYTQGNQIDLHAPFLFNFAGQPWKTQEWVHRICCDTIVSRYGTHNFFPEPLVDRVYKATPDGYLEEMDDDYGCMSSWFALSAMGLFQVCPSQTEYQIFSPIFEKVTLNLQNGKKFVIEAQGFADDCYYIQSAELNGDIYNKVNIDYGDILKGGTLIYKMGKSPNIDYGI